MNFTFSSFEIRDLIQEQLRSSEVLCCFYHGLLFPNCFYMCTWASRNHIIIVPKQGVPSGNHMDDVVEVNGSPPPPVLPGYFLHEKEPGYVTRPMYACLCIMLYTHTCFQYQWVEAQSTSSKHVHHKKVFTHECHTPEHQIVNNSVKGRGETPLRRLYHRRVGMSGIQQLWFNISIWRWLQ